VLLNFPNEDKDDVVNEAARVRAANKRKKAASKSSRFRGVSQPAKKWVVQIRVGGKRKYLGSFNDEEKAGRAYDKSVVDNNLDRPLNFPSVAEEEHGESSSEDEYEESPGESDVADEDRGAAAAAAPAAKRRRTSTHSHTVVQSDDDDKESSFSDYTVLGSYAEIQHRLYDGNWRALPLQPCQPLRPSYL
jgi:hypothetical protein